MIALVVVGVVVWMVLGLVVVAICVAAKRGDAQLTRVSPAGDHRVELGGLPLERRAGLAS